MNKDHQMFESLSKDDIEYIFSFGVTRKFPAKTRVFNQGDESNSLFFIKDGRVKIFVNDKNGKTSILRYQGAGEFFGDLGLIDARPRSATVETINEASLTQMTRAKIQLCLAEKPFLASKMVPFLAQRIRDLTDDLTMCKLGSAYLRFRAKLYDLSVIQSDQTHIISQRITQQEIGDLVGTVRENVGRFLNALKEGGYLEETAQGHLIIRRKLPEAW